MNRFYEVLESNGGPLLGATFSATIAYTASPLGCVMLLVVLLLAGIVGIVKGKLPPVDDSAALVVSILSALMVILNQMPPIARLWFAAPGALVGFFWGMWISDMLEERRKRTALDSIHNTVDPRTNTGQPQSPPSPDGPA